MKRLFCTVAVALAGAAVLAELAPDSAAQPPQRNRLPNHFGREDNTFVIAHAAYARAVAAQRARGQSVDAAKWNAVVTKAINFLKSAQEKNGGWSTAKSPGVTGVVLTGL